MRLIVAGGRDFDNYKMLEDKLNFLTQHWDSVHLLSDQEPGTSTLAERWAKRNGHRIQRFDLDPKEDIKLAPYLRQLEMVEKAEAAVIFLDVNKYDKFATHYIIHARFNGLKLKKVYYE